LSSSRWPKPDLPAGKMGRVAVLKKYRGTGVGRVLIEVLEEHLRERKGRAGEAMKGLKTVQSIAHSQAYAQGFYERVSSHLSFHLIRVVATDANDRMMM